MAQTHLRHLSCGFKYFRDVDCIYSAIVFQIRSCSLLNKLGQNKEIVTIHSTDRQWRLGTLRLNIPGDSVVFSSASSTSV
jgi:hypothetical protein